MFDDVTKKALSKITVVYVGLVILVALLKQSLFGNIPRLIGFIFLSLLAANISFYISLGILLIIALIILIIISFLLALFNSDSSWFEDFPNKILVRVVVIPLFIFYLGASVVVLHPSLESWKISLPTVIATTPTPTDIYSWVWASTPDPLPTRLGNSSETSIPTMIFIPEQKTYETAWQDDKRFRNLAQEEFIKVGSLKFGSLGVAVK